MILADYSIRKWAEENVRPFDPGLINPASLDLRFGHSIRTETPEGYSESFVIERHVMKPGDFILACTLEWIQMPPDCAGILLLKSSQGRRFLEHSHSSFVDPLFYGQLTLEISNVSRYNDIIMVPGEPIVQLVLIRCEIPIVSYGITGHYNGQMGPTKPWK